MPKAPPPTEVDGGAVRARWGGSEIADADLLRPLGDVAAAGGDAAGDTVGGASGAARDADGDNPSRLRGCAYGDAGIGGDDGPGDGCLLYTSRCV